MRIECPRCQSIVEVTGFACEVAPARLRYTCPACQAPVTEQSTLAPAPAPAPARSDLPEDLADLWKAVEEDYDTRARHDVFVSACDAQSALPVAAARYRQRLATHGPPSETERQLKLIPLLAQARILRTPRREKAERDPVRTAVFAAILLLALVLVFVVMAPWMLRLKRSHADEADGKRRARPPAVQNLAEMRPEGP